jgi:predicted AAA+ superfamily ATPase
LYRFGGDSLQGRYYYLRLHPLSFAELGGASAAALSDLLVLSGFPEPFFAGSESEARRWSLIYRERLVREEVTALETVSDLGKLELLMLGLPTRSGSDRSWTVTRQEIEAKNFDLKAVNPNAKGNEDTRTPEELMDIIEAKGREVAEALSALRRTP